MFEEFRARASVQAALFDQNVARFNVLKDRFNMLFELHSELAQQQANETRPKKFLRRHRSMVALLHLAEDTASECTFVRDYAEWHRVKIALPAMKAYYDLVEKSE